MTRRHTAAALLLALALGACAGGGGSEAAAQAPLRELPMPDGVGSGIDPARELGIGVVYFAADVEPVAASGASADTIRVVADTATAAPVALLVRTSDDMSWAYATFARDDGRPTWVEFGYEIAGVPIERVAPGGRWAEVVYAVAPTGAARLGWVRLDSAHVRTTRWEEELKGRSIFFRDSVPGGFHETPGGAALALPWAAPRWEYAMIPDSLAGDWMRVRVERPPGICGDDATHAAHAWIRWRDARGRPLVWYPTRGC